MIADGSDDNLVNAKCSKKKRIRLFIFLEFEFCSISVGMHFNQVAFSYDNFAEFYDGLCLLSKGHKFLTSQILLLVTSFWSEEIFILLKGNVCHVFQNIMLQVITSSLGV